MQSLMYSGIDSLHLCISTSNFEYINLFMNRLIIVLINKKITIITLTVNIEIIHKSTHEFFQ